MDMMAFTSNAELEKSCSKYRPFYTFINSSSIPDPAVDELQVLSDVYPVLNILTAFLVFILKVWQNPEE